MVARVGSLESSRNKRNRYTSFFLRSGNGMENIFVFPFFLDRKSHFGKEKNIYIQEAKRFRSWPTSSFGFEFPPKELVGSPEFAKSANQKWRILERNLFAQILEKNWLERSFEFPPLSRSRIGKHSVVFQFLSPDLGRKFFLLELCMDRELVAKMGEPIPIFYTLVGFGVWTWKERIAVLPDIWKDMCFFFARYLERYVFFARYLERYVFCLVLCALWLESCGVHLLPKRGSPLCFFYTLVVGKSWILSL